MIPVPGALFADVEIDGPAVEPFTADEAVDYVRQLAGVDTARLGALVVAARQWLEERTSRRLITQTRELTMDGFPCRREWVPLPSGPVQSVTFVKTRSDDGTEVAVDPATYWLDAPAGEFARLVFRSTPSGMRDHSGLAIRYVAGYGGDASAIPVPLKLAMQMVIADWYANPTGMTTGALSREVAFGVSALTAPYMPGDLG